MTEIGKPLPSFTLFENNNSYSQDTWVFIKKKNDEALKSIITKEAASNKLKLIFTLRMNYGPRLHQPEG